MVNPRQKYSEFSDMPAAMRSFLMSDEFNEKIQTLKLTYELKDEQASLLADKLMDAAFNDSSLPSAVGELKTELVPSALPENKWMIFLSDVLKSCVWPLRELYGDELTQVLNENSINPSTWPSFRVLLKPLTFSGVSSEIAAMAGFDLMGGQLRERMRELVMSKVKNVRVDSQVREVLIRSVDFGGFGLDPATADKTLELMNKILDSVKILSEEEYADYLAAEASKKNTAPLSTGIKTDDEAEIAKIQGKMPPSSSILESGLDKSVDEIFNSLSSKPTDDYLARRLKFIISSRLRDIRNQLELRQLLSRDSKVGGMGLEKSQADLIAAAIEEGYKKSHEFIKQEEKMKLEKQLEEQKVKIEERRKRDALEHAKWYQDKIQAKKVEEDKQKQTAIRVKESWATNQSAAASAIVDQKEKRLETERFGEMVQAVSAGPATASTVKPTANQQNAGPFVPKMPTMQSAHPDVRVSKTTIDLQAKTMTAKPKIDDVKFVAEPKLFGPLQEIKTLTLAEFRRMSKDPRAATEKIIQRIDILGQESFERRLEGIKVWQSCPLQQTYMQLVSESFRTGKPVVQLAEDKRQRGEDVLTPDEIAAIISLNSKLHF